MGLDIYALSNLEKSTSEVDAVIVLTENDEFGTRTDFESGPYGETSKTEQLDFSAGSYGTYNWFRNQLSIAIYGHPAAKIWENIESYEGKPFIEIINFTDCDGVIGTEVSEKLYNDFVNNRPELLKYCLNTFKEDVSIYSSFEYVIKTYDNFTEAFKLGKDSGLVIFR
jgi:hypothetical protein